MCVCVCVCMCVCVCSVHTFCEKEDTGQQNVILVCINIYVTKMVAEFSLERKNTQTYICHPQYFACLIFIDEGHC